MTGMKNSLNCKKELSTRLFCRADVFRGGDENVVVEMIKQRHKSQPGKHVEHQRHAIGDDLENALVGLAQHIKCRVVLEVVPVRKC